MANSLRDWLLETNFVIAYGAEHVMLRFSCEWWLAAKHHVNDDASRPYIDLLVIIVLHHYFRSQVVRTTDEIAHHLLLIEERREPKIGQLDAHVDRILQQDVFRFDVPMRNVHFVHVVEGVQELFGHIDDLQLGERILAFLQEVE